MQHFPQVCHQVPGGGTALCGIWLYRVLLLRGGSNLCWYLLNCVATGHISEEAIPELLCWSSQCWVGGQMVPGLIHGGGCTGGYEDSAVAKGARGSKAGAPGLRQPGLGIAFPLESG